MKKQTPIFALLSVFSSNFAVSNRYERKLTNCSDTYTLKDSERICKTFDFASLPAYDYEPYTYSENLIKAIDCSYYTTSIHFCKNYGTYSLSMEVDISFVALFHGVNLILILNEGKSYTQKIVF